MKPVLTKNAAFKLDKLTIASKQLDEKGLMDNAGRMIAQFVVENIEDPFNCKFKIISGSGNNGVDGIIAHHYFLDYNLHSTLIMIDNDTKNQWIFDAYEIKTDHIQYYNDDMVFDPDDWYLDAIFGIGLNRKISGKCSDIINKLLLCSNIIAIDIPSGIFCDSGSSSGCNISATATLSMGHPKIGHYFNRGLESRGELNILDIGFKELDNPMEHIQIIDEDDILDLLPENSLTDHKYLRGKVLAITASTGFTGAGILACDAAVKTGAGMVKAIIPESINMIFESNLIETVTMPMSEYIPGRISLENIEEIMSIIGWADTLLFGPGLAADKESAVWMAEVLKAAKIPTVLDASGFLPLIENKISISDLAEETILTPHYNEFAKLFKIELGNILKSPVEAVKQIIPKLNGRVMILKGPTTIIVGSKKQIYFMDHGLPSLATAGTGDVLSGILAALLAKGLSLDNAAIAGTFLHAECAWQYRILVGDNGLTASDLSQIIPHTIEALNHVD